jgi:arsenate reductase-like glutaredoxin family protein
VEDRNIIVINKFYDTEGRINVLLDILGQTEVPVEALSEKSLKLYKQLEKNELITAEEEE